MLGLDPFAPLFEMQRTLDRFSAAPPRATFIPPADITVTEEAVTVFLDVPGLTADGLEVHLQDDVLSIRGERRWPYAAMDGGVRRVERGVGKFERTLRVPAGLDPDAIAAHLEDGVLRLTLPKPAEQRPRRITITGGADQRELAASTG